LKQEFGNYSRITTLEDSLTNRENFFHLIGSDENQDLQLG